MQVPRVTENKKNNNLYLQIELLITPAALPLETKLFNLVKNNVDKRVLPAGWRKACGRNSSYLHSSLTGSARAREYGGKRRACTHLYTRTCRYNVVYLMNSLWAFVSPKR